MDRVVSSRNPWRWMSNSCHLDTWLMVELSFFGRLASFADTPLIDSLLDTSPALSKLFKVLSAAGTDNQDALKMAYWAMEIESYLGGTRAARTSFGQFSDYQKHGELMHIHERSNAKLDITSTYIGMRKTCSNPNHDITTSDLKRIPQVTTEDCWFAMPDDWSRTQDAAGRWRTEQVSQVHNTGLGDVVETLLGRSDGETTNCTTCCQTQPGTCFQESSEKIPKNALLPISLEFNVDPDSSVPVERELCIGGLGYTLLAVVFGNGMHFKCNIVLCDVWYHYDDLGLVINNSMTNHFLVRITAPSTFLTPPPLELGFKPIVYRYIRHDISTITPLLLSTPDVIHTGLQFNSMWRLLVQGYE
jgi:hypothetical protein